MTQLPTPSTSPSPAPDVHAPGRSPGPHRRALVVFLLRMGMGVYLLKGGVTGFFLAQAVRARAASPFGQVSPAVSSWAADFGGEVVADVLPFVQIVAGVGLLLGFLTTTAAVVAAVLALATPAVQVTYLMVSGLMPASPPNTYFNGYDPVGHDLLARVGMTQEVGLSVALIWLTGLGWDRWSLDALMFGGGRRVPRRAKVVPRPPDLG